MFNIKDYLEEINCPCCFKNSFKEHSAATHVDYILSAQSDREISDVSIEA